MKNIILTTIYCIIIAIIIGLFIYGFITKNCGPGILFCILVRLAMPFLHRKNPYTGEWN